MRDFINAIFDFIVTASISDEEFETVESSTQVYSEELYTELLAVIDSRELVSSTRDRLRYYFLAAGVAVTESSPGKSNIYAGAVLE